jgi:zinc finger BED domain-containing protein 1 (E3 SUMO-protein ligase ZBED1)
LGYWATHDRHTANFNSGRSHLNGSRLATSIATFRDYESRDLLQRTKDPLEWWKQNGNHALLKNLIPTVKKWMCVPATSVPSERVFSTMGELISERRNRLSPRLVNMVMFLNKNLDD